MSRRRAGRGGGWDSVPAEVLLATLPVGVISYHADGQCESANEAASELLGLSHEALLAQNFRYIPSWQDSGVLAHAERVLKSGQPYRAEVKIRTTSGRDLVLDWRLQPVHVDGRAGLLLVFADVTERARMQSSLKLMEFSMNHASDSIFWVDPEGRLVEVSESMCRRLGYSRAQLLGMRLFDISADTSPADWSVKWAQMKRDGSLTFESHHRTRTGEVFPVEVTANYVEFGGREYDCAFARDITARKRIEDALRLTQLSVDRAADLIHWISPDGRILYVSDSNCRRHGYSREEMLALSVFDLDPTMSPSAWTAHWKELQERGSLSFETTHRTKDGELFPVEVTANYVEQDGAQYNFAFARDISDRRRLERSLRLTQFSLDHSTDYIFWIDREGRLLNLNEGTLRRLGYEPSEAVGLTIFDIDPQAPQPWDEHWARLKAHGSLTFETVHMTKAGEVFPVEVTASYVEFDGQELDCGLARDISERKVAEAELREAKEAAERANAELLATQRILELQARTDPLTGVMNRRAILERLREEMARAERYGTLLAIAMIDIDHFKDVNDSIGHGAGDEVLREVVARASEALRPYDGFGRFGGEEFLAVLPQASGPQVERALERVRLAICTTPIEVFHHEVSVAVSIGAALSHGESLDELIRSADEALYQAKAEGRNRVALSASTPAPETD